MRREDVVVAVVALAACALAFGLTYRFTTTTPGAMMSGMGAEFFPRLVIGVIAVLAVCIAFGIGSPAMQKPAPVPPIVWITAAVLASYVVALELIGMWAASLLVMVVLGRLWGERRLARLVLASAGLLGVVYLVFIRFLKGGFPEGLVARLWS
jgi:hypothetical protein